jgi:hypothetical protein
MLSWIGFLLCDFVKVLNLLNSPYCFRPSQYNSEEVEVTHRTIDLSVDMDGSRVTAAPSSTRSGTKPPVTPDRGQSKAKKKGLFSGLFSRKRDGAVTPSAARAGSRVRAIRKVKG